MEYILKSWSEMHSYCTYDK